MSQLPGETNVAYLTRIKTRYADVILEGVGTPTEFREVWLALAKAVKMFEGGAKMICPNCGALAECALCGGRP